MINPQFIIITRTHQRPKYFVDCMTSILSQTYKNYKVFIGVEQTDTISEKYVKEYIKDKNNYYLIKMIPIIHKELPPINNIKSDYGIWFPYNSYLDTMTREIAKQHQGFFVFIDDDDCFKNIDSLKIIAENIETEKDCVYWKVEFPNNNVIPENYYWKLLTNGFEPFACHISGLGFAYHSIYANDVEWGKWSLGDYRVAKKLYYLCNEVRYIDKILTSIQDVPHYGKNIDKN